MVPGLHNKALLCEKIRGVNICAVVAVLVTVIPG